MWITLYAYDLELTDAVLGDHQHGDDGGWKRGLRVNPLDMG